MKNRPKQLPVNDGLPSGLTEQDLPPHHRGQWTFDTYAVSPDGSHVVTLFAINEVTMGYETAKVLWSTSNQPTHFLGTIERLPMMRFTHWIDNQRFAVKLHVFNRDWVRPMVVIDLANGFTVLPQSNGAAPDMGLWGRPVDAPFRPYDETALAVETDLAHLL